VAADRAPRQLVSVDRTVREFARISWRSSGCPSDASITREAAGCVGVVSEGAGKHQCQIVKISPGLLELSPTAHADNRGDRTAMAGDDQV
jgi:hypothetical protein